jgi:hypothetical protein
MKVLIGFLLGAFFLGGSTRANWLKSRPLLLFAIAVVFAASYWSIQAST